MSGYQAGGDVTDEMFVGTTPSEESQQTTGEYIKGLYKENIPVHARVYLETLLGKKDPITADDFTKEELADIEKLLSSKPAKGAVTEYSDYEKVRDLDREGRHSSDWLENLPSVGKTLGRFTYETLPDGRRVIKDTYDFYNTSRSINVQEFEEMGPAEKALAVFKKITANRSMMDPPFVKRAADILGEAYIGRDGRPVKVEYDPKDLPVKRQEGSPPEGEVNENPYVRMAREERAAQDKAFDSVNRQLSDLLERYKKGNEGITEKDLLPFFPGYNEYDIAQMYGTTTESSVPSMSSKARSFTPEIMSNLRKYDELMQKDFDRLVKEKRLPRDVITARTLGLANGGDVSNDEFIQEMITGTRPEDFPETSPVDMAVSDFISSRSKLVTDPQEFFRVMGENIKQQYGDINNDPKAMEAFLMDNLGFGGLTAYHASGKMFKQLDPSKAKSGVGEQRYGTGAGYTAESRPVAESFMGAEAQALRASGALDPKLEFVYDLVSQKRSDMDVLDAIAAKYGKNIGFDEAQDILKKAKSITQGYLYKGDIPDEIIPSFLDWNKSLKQQTAEVKKLLSKDPLVKESVDPANWREVSGGIIQKGEGGLDDLTGDSIYKYISLKLGSDSAATDYLDKLGVRGIRYADPGSKGLGREPSGTSNFVVFRPEDYRIESVNDVPVGKTVSSPKAFKQVFEQVDKLPTNQLIDEVMSAHIGGVGDFGDETAKYYLSQIPGGADYIKASQELAKKNLGNQFMAYRLMPKDQFEALQAGDVGDLLSFSLSQSSAEALKKFVKNEKRGDLVVAEVPLTPEHVVAFGSPSEQEVIIDTGVGWSLDQFRQAAPLKKAQGGEVTNDEFIQEMMTGTRPSDFPETSPVDTAVSDYLKFQSKAVTDPKAYMQALGENIKKYHTDPLQQDPQKYLMEQLGPGQGLMGAIKPRGGIMPTTPGTPWGEYIDEVVGAAQKSYANIASDRREGVVDFIKKKLGKYIRSDFGTEEDPLRRAIESGRLETFGKDKDTFRSYALKAAREGDPDAVFDVTKAYDIGTGIRPTVMLPTRDFGEGQLAKQKAVDDLVSKIVAEGGDPEIARSMVERQLRSVSRDETDKVLQTGEEGYSKVLKTFGVDKNRPKDMGFFERALDQGDIAYGKDFLNLQFLRPQDLAEALGAIPSNKLASMDFPEAVVEGNRLMKKSRDLDENIKIAEKGKGSTLPKEILFFGTKPLKTPAKSGQWINITDPDAARLEGALMRHSVHGYGKDGPYGLGGKQALLSGKANLFSLRDEKGIPMVTVEIENMAMQKMSDREARKTPDFKVRQVQGKFNSAPEDYIDDVFDLAETINGRWSEGPAGNQRYGKDRSGKDLDEPKIIEWGKLFANRKAQGKAAGGEITKFIKDNR
jgi:hypothetical protein